MKSDKIIVTKYKLKSVSFSLCIALVTDFHECGSDCILQLLKQEHPDVILIAGDLLERHEEGMSEWTQQQMNKWMRKKESKGCGLYAMFRKAAYKMLDLQSLKEKRTHPENSYIFLREASNIAPVYYSVGNHEWYFTNQDYQVFRENQIILLDNSDTVFHTLDTYRVLIGGLSTRYDLQWLDAFSQKSGYKILLCHHPEYYKWYIKDTPLDVFDLILSGHAHGGQWRIFGRGVFAPGQGIFPKYDHGVYETNGGKLIVSAGVFNTARVPRFGNPCELVMIKAGTDES